MAPTYPECDEEDLKRTLEAIKDLNPITIFHEPINIRTKNVERIEAHAKELGVSVRTDVFKTREAWRRYAVDSLVLMQKAATDLNLLDRLHLWPDSSLAAKTAFMRIRSAQRGPQSLTKRQQQQAQQQDEQYYNEQYHPWIEKWWSRISEWPG